MQARMAFAGKASEAPTGVWNPELRGGVFSAAAAESSEGRARVDTIRLGGRRTFVTGTRSPLAAGISVRAFSGVSKYFVAKAYCLSTSSIGSGRARLSAASFAANSPRSRSSSRSRSAVRGAGAGSL